MFSPSDLAKLAQMKAQSNQQLTGETSAVIDNTPFDPTPVQEPPAGSGLGFGHEGSAPRTPDSRGNFGAFGIENDVNSNRDNPYGVRSVHDNATGFGFSGNPEHFITNGNPANMQGATVGYGSQQQASPPPLTGNPMGMFNGLAGISNAVRGINGQQQPNTQQPQQESPNWGQNTNPATAGSPPSHGGGNPGYSGMMTNTADTMAALKAMIANLSRR